MVFPDLKKLGIKHLGVHTEVDVSPSVLVILKDQIFNPKGKRSRARAKEESRNRVSLFQRYKASGQLNGVRLLLSLHDETKLHIGLVIQKSAQFTEYGRLRPTAMSPEQALEILGQSELKKGDAVIVADFIHRVRPLTPQFPLPLRLPTLWWGLFNEIIGIRIGAVKDRGKIGDNAIIELVNRTFHFHFHLTVSVQVGPSFVTTVTDYVCSVLERMVVKSIQA